ncbi:MAG: carbon-nitrogen hydrolase, partial [Bacteroidota bacterium]|nr:carbon-nitrogen hydrolase [Bacteroidota bacterium]
METNTTIGKVEIRNLQIEDYKQLNQTFESIYRNLNDEFWTKSQIKKLINIFPEGQLAAVVDGKIVGCALSIIVDYDKLTDDHTYNQVIGDGTFNTHDPNGNVLYG